MLTLNKRIEQGDTIGIIGGGQLGQMLAFSAKAAGMKVIVIDPDPTCPTGQVCDRQIVAPYDDVNAIQQLAAEADVLTYEFENVDLDALDAVKDVVSIPQGTELLRITKDRIREKTFLKEHGFQTAKFAAINNEHDFQIELEKIGFPCYLKTCEGGYDGKGQVRLNSEKDLGQTKEILQHCPCILEKDVDFKCECSVMVGRNVDGAISVFPVSENIHRNQILHESIVPARIPGEVAVHAEETAVAIARALDLCGILGIEMFIGNDNQVYINELAPRPHNSGHYSIEACNFSQFDIHNRAICNWPMPQIKLLQPVVMVNVLGQHVSEVRNLIFEKPDWHFHDYGKNEVRLNRKMGHVTILTNQLDQTLKEIDQTGIWEQ